MNCDWLNLTVIRTEEVMVVTTDGRILVGIFVGHDQHQNTILKESHERIYSASDDVERVPLGVYVVRGDSLCIIAEFEDGENADSIRVPDPIPQIRQQQY